MTPEKSVCQNRPLFVVPPAPASLAVALGVALLLEATGTSECDGGCVGRPDAGLQAMQLKLAERLALALLNRPAALAAFTAIPDTQLVDPKDSSWPETGFP